MNRVCLLIPEEYLGTTIKAFVRSKKTKLTCESWECTVRDTILVPGQYDEYNLSILPVGDLCIEMRVGGMVILMRGALQRSHLPEKWRIDLPNKKLKLKNNIIDWLQTDKLGWELSYAQHLGVAFVNSLANTLWIIDSSNISRLKLSGPYNVCPLPGLQKHKIDHSKLNENKIHAYSVSLFTLAT